MLSSRWSRTHQVFSPVMRHTHDSAREYSVILVLLLTFVSFHLSRWLLPPRLVSLFVHYLSSLSLFLFLSRSASLRLLSDKCARLPALHQQPSALTSFHRLLTLSSSLCISPSSSPILSPILHLLLLLFLCLLFSLSPLYDAAYLCPLTFSSPLLSSFLLPCSLFIHAFSCTPFTQTYKHKHDPIFITIQIAYCLAHALSSYSCRPIPC